MRRLIGAIVHNFYRCLGHTSRKHDRATQAILLQTWQADSKLLHYRDCRVDFLIALFEFGWQKRKREKIYTDANCQINKKEEYRITLQRKKQGAGVQSLEIKLPNMGMERSSRLWTSISPKEPVPTNLDPAVLPLPEKMPPADSTAAGRIDDKEKLGKVKKGEDGDVVVGEVGVDEACSWA